MELAIQDKWQHGDTFVCYGSGFASAGIMAWLSIREWWKWWRNGFKAPSHIAFLIQHPSPPDFLLFESTTMSKSPDSISGKLRKGVQTHRVDEWLSDYAGKVDLYRLKVPQRVASRMNMQQYCQDVHEAGVKYDMGQALGSSIGIVYNTEDGTKLFCSEFWAFAMQKGGSVGKHVNCSEVNPLDVVSLKCLKYERRIKK